MSRERLLSGICLIAGLATGASLASGRSRPDTTLAPERDSLVASVSEPEPVLYASPRDSVRAMRTASAARQATELRVLVSLRDRALVVLRENDTLLNAAIAIPNGRRLTLAGRSWLFVAPAGVRRVGRKDVEPRWVPPEWHYAELATEHNLRLQKLERRNPIVLSDGTRLEVRGIRVGQVGLDGRFTPFSPHHEIVRDSTVFIPPPGTVNRMIEGELGRFSLDLGDGYLIHGTPQPESVGAAVTHGCFRLGDEQMEWLFRHIPVGTRVYIF